MASDIHKSLPFTEWGPSSDGSSFQNLMWIYCPGRAEMRGKEQADRLASISSIAGTSTMDKEDVVKNTVTSIYLGVPGAKSYETHSLDDSSIAAAIVVFQY